METIFAVLLLIGARVFHAQTPVPSPASPSPPLAADTQGSAPAQPGDVSACNYKGLKIAYISLTVTKEGKPLDIKLEHSSGNQCIDQQAIQIAAGYTFRPARKIRGPGRITYRPSNEI
ncbi:MAG TPA: energy transducer TonB [Acidobacteriaceae bacterium]|jgi:TonB family protein|nr:energy transducer TonB [Acidobacteriaceae bacterium]